MPRGGSPLLERALREARTSLGTGGWGERYGAHPSATAATQALRTGARPAQQQPGAEDLVLSAFVLSLIHLTLDKLLRIYKHQSPFYRPSERLSNTPKATQPGVRMREQGPGSRLWVPERGELNTDAGPPTQTPASVSLSRGHFGSDGAGRVGRA